MDDKLERISKSVEDLKRQIAAIQQKVSAQESTLAAIAKDVGTQDSKNMSDIINKMDGYMSRDTASIQSILSDVEETRRTTANLELMIKDILKGMGMIYYSVDELEENLVPERQTK